MTPARDRFADIVDKLPKYYDTDDTEGINAMLEPDDVVKLLKREHAALVRAVKRLQNDCIHGPEIPHSEAATCLAYRQAIDDVLALLANRKGRKG